MTPKMILNWDQNELFSILAKMRYIYLRIRTGLDTYGVQYRDTPYLYREVFVQSSKKIHT